MTIADMVQEDLVKRPSMDEVVLSGQSHQDEWKNKCPVD
jgi:hypothetical protein